MAFDGGDGDGGDAFFRIRRNNFILGGKLKKSVAAMVTKP